MPSSVDLVFEFDSDTVVTDGNPWPRPNTGYRLEKCRPQ